MKRVALLLILGLSLGACAAGHRNSKPLPALRSRGFVAAVSDPGSLIGVSSVTVAPVLPDSDLRLTALEREVLNALYLAVTQEESSLEVTRSHSLEEKAGHSTAGPDDAFLRAARSDKSDAVLILELHRYVERNGSRLEAIKGAEVDFALRLVRAADGKAVFGGSYHFEDRALSDNLLHAGDTLRAGRGSRWSTARELFEEGLRLAWREFSARREQAFLAGEVAE